MNRLRVSLLAAALACAGGAAFADLLITRDGATIETAGAWKVDGRRVLFTLPNGTLSSIRTDEVDLDRSALATARAAEAASAEEAPAPPASAPILVLNEDDIAKDEESQAAEGEKKAETESAPGSPLVVASWEQVPLADGDGVQLFGVVRNTAKSHLTAVTVTAVLYGEEGGMLANGDAQLNKTTIGPGETANFRIEFPGLPDFASVKFQTAARGFNTNAELATEEELEQLAAEADAEGDAGEGAPEESAVEGEPSEAERAAASEAAAAAAYEANLKATGDEPPPLER